MSPTSAKPAGPCRAPRDAASANSPASSRPRRIRSTWCCLGQLFKVGRLYAGSAQTRNGQSVDVWLEFTEAPAGSRQIHALLRNDGGWQDARMDTDDPGLDLMDRFTAALNSRDIDAVMALVTENGNGK